MEAVKFTRLCPNCGKEIFHTNKYNCSNADKKRRECRSCQAKRKVGDKNPFYGKNHSQESKDKISYFNSEIRVLSNDFIELAKENLSKVSNNRPLYDIWFEKFGKEIADQKLQEFKLKQSENNKGSKNGMFGKPAPQGSGNGWAGWYKNWFFRSLRELSYMINFIEKENLIWETPKIKIKYLDFQGVERNYFPDFLINGIKLVEIKPTKLHNSPKVLAKKLAAEQYCLNNNLDYEMFDPKLISNEQIKQMYIVGEIIFLDKYKQKFEERYL